MKKKEMNIKWKLYFYLIGFCILLLGILWLLQIVLLEQFYKSIKMSEIKKVSSGIVEYVVNGDWESVEQIASSRGDLYVELWSAELKTITSTGNFREWHDIPLTDTDKKELYEKTKSSNDSIIRKYRNDTQNSFDRRPLVRESIIYAAQISSSTYQDVLLMVSAEITPLNATVETLRIQLGYISVIMLILSIGLSFLISRRVAKPIMQLNNSAMELGKGKYETTFDGKGYKEIRELSDTLTHAASELGKTETLRRELLANVSHDLRTPLTLITGYSEMIRDFPEENTTENMQVIIEESERLTVLVNDMLDLSQMQSGNLKMHFTIINITQVVESIINRIRKLYEPEFYDICFTYEEEIYVQADSHRMSQVIYNLLINAIKYSGDDKKIIICQEIRNDIVKIQIIDNGCGMPDNELLHVWDRYYKTEKSNHKKNSHSYGGTGIGLSIVKSILEQHKNAEFGVVSQVGKGSNFWFSFPISKEEV